VRAQPLEAVVKPLGECSGRGIAFFAPSTPTPELAAYWAALTDPDGAVVQPYQPAITTHGDLRILVMNRRVLGSVARIPRPGSRLANLHQGASVRPFDPTPRQLAAVAAVADALTPRGLYLLGLDFIGDLLSEINFTSPSALVQINEVSQTRAELVLVDEIERLAALRPAVA
jgi:glutathione synthase